MTENHVYTIDFMPATAPPPRLTRVLTSAPLYQLDPVKVEALIAAPQFTPKFHEFQGPKDMEKLT